MNDSSGSFLSDYDLDSLVSSLRDLLSNLEAKATDTVLVIQTRATPQTSFGAGLTLGSLLGFLTAWAILRKSSPRRPQLHVQLQKDLEQQVAGEETGDSPVKPRDGGSGSSKQKKRGLLASYWESRAEPDSPSPRPPPASLGSSSASSSPSPFARAGSAATPLTATTPGVSTLYGDAEPSPLYPDPLTREGSLANVAVMGDDSKVSARRNTNESLHKYDTLACHTRLLEIIGPLTTLANLEHDINMMFNQRKISRVFKIEDLVEFVAADGDTLLTQAVKVKNSQLVLKLLKLGSDPNHSDGEDSVLVGACEMLAQDLVFALLATPGLELLSQENRAVLTRLLSIHFGDQSERKTMETLALRLISAGADVLYRAEVTLSQRTEELSALELAVEKGFSTIVNAIVARYPSAVEATFKKGQRTETLLHRAVRENDLDSVRILLKVDLRVMDLMVAAVDGEGKTVLHVAAGNRVPLVLPVLLEDSRIKTLINQQDAHRETALHYVARNRNADMFRILMIQGADPNIANSDNESAFGIAITEGLNIQI